MFNDNYYPIVLGDKRYIGDQCAEELKKCNAIGFKME